MKHNSSHTTRVSILAAFLTFTVLGCVSVSYKPGGSGGDLQRATDHCRDQGHAAGADLDHCLQEQGWTVKQLGAAAAAGETNTSTPTAPPAPAASPHDTPAAAKASEPSPTQPPAPAAPQTAPARSVSSWFKVGGTADQLTAAKQRCANKLAAVEHTDPQSQTVSAAMLDCMRDEGWHAF